ncbi:hypothetical protein [Ottowia caeni]|uniref:hypothetical protein n=1 Tax=Ottowia caeni TaxID=2870339 RepID=UPI003D75F2DC
MAQDGAKPVLLIGNGYSRHERQVIIKNILEPKEVTFENGGDFVSAETWGKYSLVIVTHGFAKINSEEIGWIRDYVRNGGRLIITSTALESLRNLQGGDRDWIGAIGYRTVPKSAKNFALVGDLSQTFLPDSESAGSVFGLTSGSSPTSLTTAEAVVTRDGAPIVFRNRYGRGELWFVGFEYFRVLNTEKLASAKLAVGKPAENFLEKIIFQGKVQKRSERIAAGLRRLGSNKPIVWWRDFTHARGASFAEPPYPEKDEGVSLIQIDLGLNEWESVPFNISSVEADDRFTVTVSDLTSVDGKHKISAESVRLRLQGVAASHLTVGPYWLLELSRRDAPAAANFDVPFKANQSNTLWLTLNTFGTKPGLYRGQIRFSQVEIKPVDLLVQVWPVELPGREYFQGEATFMWSSLMNGENGKSYDFPESPGDMEAFRRHIQNLSEHYIALNIDSSWAGRFGGSVSLKNAKLKNSIISLEQAIESGLIKEDSFPELDLSYFDPFVEIPLLAGMPYFHFAFKNHDSAWLNYSRAITGDKELSALSPRHLAVKRWILGEIVRYLRGKGITQIVSFIADEIAPNKISDVLRRAQLLHEFGIRIEFTATGETGQTREHISRLDPAIDRWIWNAAVMPQAKAIVSADNSPIGKADQQFTYVADWHRAPYVFNRTRGAFSAYHGLDGLFIHGYLRWYPNGGAVWKTPEGPIDTEGWEGARDGIEDARYWKRAQFLLNAAKKNPKLATHAARIEQTMSRWVAPDPSAFVELVDTSYHIYRFQSPISTYGRLQMLKRELLTSLAWLDENVPTLTDLSYAGLTLKDARDSTVSVLGDSDAIESFNRTLVARNLPQLSSNTEGQVKLVFGTRGQVQDVLGQEFAGDVNPAPGQYHVVLKERTVAVIGGDSSGLQKGAKILGQLVESSETLNAIENQH